MTDIVVPQWGLTTDDATLQTWLKAVGDRVEAGEPIAEMETDKTNADLDAPAAGTIVELLVDEGAEVTPGQVVARLSDD
jgi:pyruvate/2-oxoglutarate dehydrogenase complex dihydrolipoamide acyltransferase (E2) component